MDLIDNGLWSGDEAKTVGVKYPQSKLTIKSR
jgi:hypothetical protein